MRDRKQAVEAVMQAMLEPTPYWEESRDAREIAERIIDAYEALPPAEPEAAYWERRYDEQHRTLHAAEDEIARLRAALKP